MTGIGIFGLAATASGLLGALLWLMPSVPRRALIYGLSVTLLVGAFGETVRPGVAREPGTLDAE